jgi:hypothetical protein
MKDQYFPDGRDYLKYHVLEELVRGIPVIRRLTILWMLTAPDNSGEGRIDFDDNPELPELTAFLRRQVALGNRRIRSMREYFRERAIAYTAWHDEPPYFTRSTRGDYFKDVPGRSLERAVVFVDPDIGLTRGTPDNKHISLQEFQALYERLPARSILVLYQHRQREKSFWWNWGTSLAADLSADVWWITDGALALYVIPKGRVRLTALRRSLTRVTQAAAKRSIGSTVGQP